MILHIVNGDCALKHWRQCRFAGEVMVWRENYLQGMIPETNDIILFNQIRAKELHKIAPEKSFDEIFAELQNMYHKLFSMRSSDKLILWLDCCPFDRALKKQLLKFISALPEKPELFLIQQDVVWDKENFERYRNWEDNSYNLTQADL